MHTKTSLQQSPQTEQRTVPAQPGLAGQRTPDRLGAAGLLLSLQRSHGNRFVQRLLDTTMLQRECGCGGTCADCRQDARTEEQDRPGLPQKSATLPTFIQAKLTVSQPGDPYEQEADRVADQVLRKVTTAEPMLRNQEAEPSLQRAENSTTSDDNAMGNPLIDQINALLAQDGVQAKSESEGASVSEGFESELSGTKGAGQRIPYPARAEMENAFGADFSNVRLHTDSHAVDMSRRIGAHAFTHGNDIYFNQGMFNPSTADGQHLLAHELTHTIQQGVGQIRRLTITRNLRDELHCGARRVRWTFALDAPATEDGYIVQRIRNLQTIENCPSNVGSISTTPTMEFWEAWDVKKGDTVDWTTTRDHWTDESGRPPETTKSGMQASLGTVKFFLRSVTGDLGGFGVAPAAAGSSWGPGKAPPSGALPSTQSEPSWWNTTPAEGPARRWASSWWNCCGEESAHFSKIDSSP